MTQVLKGWADADVAFVSFLFCNIISCKVSCAHALSRARVHLRQKWTGFSGAALLWQPVQEQPHSLTSLTERAWGETTSLGSLLLFLHLAPHRLHVLLSFLPSFKFSSLFFCSRYVFPLSLYSVYVVFFFVFFNPAPVNVGLFYRLLDICHSSVWNICYYVSVHWNVCSQSC